MRDLAGTDFGEDDETGRLELTYSTQSGINRAKPTFGTLALRIIQVEHVGKMR